MKCNVSLQIHLCAQKIFCGCLLGFRHCTVIVLRGTEIQSFLTWTALTVIISLYNLSSSVSTASLTIPAGGDTNRGRALCSENLQLHCPSFRYQLSRRRAQTTLAGRQQRNNLRPDGNTSEGHQWYGGVVIIRAKKARNNENSNGEKQP